MAKAKTAEPVKKAPKAKKAKVQPLFYADQAKFEKAHTEAQGNPKKTKAVYERLGGNFLVGRGVHPVGKKVN
jgi:hypothetical protein